MHLLNNVSIFLVVSAGALISVRLKKLTPLGGLAGIVVAMLVYTGGGYNGLGMLAAFFILGTLATSWRKKEKTGASARTMGQVFANGGVAALAGLGILLFPGHRHMLSLVMAASLASAAADTLSSELGMVYGRRYWNILTWKPDRRGLDGVISIEGLLIGMMGSVVIAGIYALDHGWDRTLWIIVLSGTVGNLIDSVLGASLERKGYVGNDMVNFLNTLAAGIIAAALF